MMLKYVLLLWRRFVLIKGARPIIMIIKIKLITIIIGIIEKKSLLLFLVSFENKLEMAKRKTKLLYPNF